MKIILSPAKKMNVNTDILEYKDMPVFMDKAKEILKYLQSKSYTELKKLWGCNDKIAEQNIERLKDMDLYNNLTPAIISYEGIAYQYMAPNVLEDDAFDYIQEHLRILSGFYGVLKPLDGITPYRLEMQAKAAINGSKDLYDFWGKLLYEEVRDDSGIIVNLASKEYSKCIEKYLTDDDIFINISFVEMGSSGKLVTKGTYAKMARGEMVRYMAENIAQSVDDIKGFDRLGYSYRDDLSSDTELVFERK